MGLLNATINLIATPAGMWEGIIFAFEKGLNNYALAIILMTLLTKVVTMPFDFINKIITKANTRKQAKIQPELNKINVRYANNPSLKNQKTSELYKKEDYNIIGTCLGMMVYMILTLIIFSTLFVSLGRIADYKLREEFVSVHNAYYTEYDRDKTLEESVKISNAQDKALLKYDEVKTGFLWIKSIWRPDTGASSTVSYKDFTKKSAVGIENLTEVDYNNIMGKINEKYKSWNGYFILPILAVISSYFSLQINVFISKFKAKKAGRPYVAGADANKIMAIILPITMGIFACVYNAAFAIYIVLGSIFGMITTPIITLIVDAIDDKKMLKEEKKHMANYSRKNK